MGSIVSMGVQPFNQSARNAPAVGTLATIASAAPSQAAASVVVTSISASIVAGVGAEAGTLILRDGATGVGAIVWSMQAAAPASGLWNFSQASLSIQMTPGNVATLEFLAAPTGTGFQNVALTSYITNQIEDSRALGRIG